MRPHKFNFSKILFNGGAAEKNGDPSVMIGKNGQMVINKAANHAFDLDGAFVDLIWDAEKRALGMRKMNGQVLPDKEWTKSMRLLKADAKGKVKVSIGRVMNALGIEKENYQGLLMETYIDQLENNTIYYVILPRVKKQDNG